MRRVVSGIVVVLLLLLTAACGGDDTSEDAPEAKVGTIADVSVSGPTDERPQLEYKPPLAFEQTEGEVVDKGPGKGDAVALNSTVKVDYEFVNAADNEVVDSTWETKKPATFQLATVLPGLGTGLIGAHAGDRVLVVISPEDGIPNGNGTTIRKGDSLIIVVDVRSVSTPGPLPPAQLPTIESDKKGDPTGFVAKPQSPPQLESLGVNVVEEGDGPVLEPGQTLTVEYLGQVYPDGGVFDESYTKKEPVSLSLAQVIPGWQQGLVGQKVGSRVVLTIPSELAYGASGQGKEIPPDSDLIFVIDIEQAS